MAADTLERPSAEEHLLSAANTSNMTLDLARRSPAADTVMAAGMAALNGARLGVALIHLAAEWDKCAKPRKRTQEEIAQRASELPQKKGKPDLHRASVEALVWHSSALREKAANLTGRNAVLGMLTDWANERGVDVDLLSPALFHFLAPACPVCSGLGVQKIQDAPSLSDRACLHCRGVGTWPRPLGAQGIHDHIRSCVGAARGQLAQRLRG
jgi:hypothetical protein